MTAKTLTPFENLKTQLSKEKSKKKDNRDKALLKSLHSQINEHKKNLTIEFRKKSRENHKMEVQDRLKLERKMIDRYMKIHDKRLKVKLKEKAEEEAKLKNSNVGKKKK